MGKAAECGFRRFAGGSITGGPARSAGGASDHPVRPKHGEVIGTSDVREKKNILGEWETTFGV